MTMTSIFILPCIRDDERNVPATSVKLIHVLTQHGGLNYFFATMGRWRDIRVPSYVDEYFKVLGNRNSPWRGRFDDIRVFCWF